MPTDIDPVKAARAVSLRRLATQLENCQVDGLALAAGEQTWIGPTADRCRQEVEAQRAAIAVAVVELRFSARRLETAPMPHGVS